MQDFMEVSSRFRPTEVRTLAQAYAYALVYFDFEPGLTLYERHCLAQLTLVAGATRRRLNKSLDSFVDAHALSAQVVEYFVLLKELEPSSDAHYECPRRFRS